MCRLLIVIIVVLGKLLNVCTLHIPECPSALTGSESGSQTRRVLKDSFLMADVDYAWLHSDCEPDQRLIGPSRLLCRLGNEKETHDDPFLNSFCQSSLSPFCTRPVLRNEEAVDMDVHISHLYFALNDSITFRCRRTNDLQKAVCQLITQNGTGWSREPPDCHSEAAFTFRVATESQKDEETTSSIVTNETSLYCRAPTPASSQSFSVGVTIDFECSHNGNLESNLPLQATCQNDGSWSSVWPRCRVPCIFNESSKGHMECFSRPKLHLDESRGRVEGQNSQCIENAECRSALCTQLPSPPSNGIVMWLEKGLRARFECRAGFAPSMLIERASSLSTELKCIFGTWSNLGSMKCFQLLCPYIGSVSNAQLRLHQPENKFSFDFMPYVRRVRHGVVADLHCHQGFTPDGKGETSATCINGRWSPARLAGCIPSSSSSSSTGRGRGRGHGQTFPSDDTHVKLRGRRSLSDCESLLSNTPHLIVSEKSSEDGSSTSTFKVTCAQGYLLSPTTLKSSSTVTCSATAGEAASSLWWRPARPWCSPGGCRLPPSSGHAFFVTMDAIRLVAEAEVADTTRILVQCEANFTPKTQRVLKCHLGQWLWADNGTRVESRDLALLTCLGRNCTLPDIDYVAFEDQRNAGDVLDHGQSVGYVCREGSNSNNNSEDNRASRRSRCIDGYLEPILCNAVLPNEGWMSADNALSLTKSLLTSEKKRGCSEPNDPDDSENSERTIEHGTTITFDCDLMFKEEMKSKVQRGNETVSNESTNVYSWRIVCDNGKWKGERLEKCPKGASSVSSLSSSSSSFNSPCLYSVPSDPNVRSFTSTSLQLSEPTRIPSGGIVYYRCRDIGKYRMEPRRRQRVCSGGFWTPSEEPRCESLSQMHDYDPDYRPTILFRVSNGHIGQTRDGWLAVTPGSIVHMECLFRRTLAMGSPMWRVENFSGRTYPQGWTTAPGRDARLEYRLSIYHARHNDTGVYTCMTPARKKHAVRVIVKRVECPRLADLPPGIRASDSNATHLGARVRFECGPNVTLKGEQWLTCQPSGTWNFRVPFCQNSETTPTLCPESIITHSPPRLVVEVQSFAIGGTVSFACDSGFRLQGQNRAVCRSDGVWSLKFPPRCVPTHCPPLPKIRHAKVARPRDAGPVRPGETVAMRCQLPFKPSLTLMTCGEDGQWMGEPAKCTRACNFPGSIDHGGMERLKFQYSHGEIIVFECNEGFQLQGPAKIKCLSNGTWSAQPPLCKAIT